MNSVSLNLQSFCQNDGDPGLVAVTNVVVTVLNIFLDWLFVFPMQKGVAGAAIATGISQVVGLLVILTHFIFKKGDLQIKKYKPQGKLYSKIVLRGLPEAIALNIVRSLVMNSLVITFVPMIFGKAVVWHTFGIYEILVLVVALTLKKVSERNGITYSTD